MKPIVIIGTGGHSKVVLDILQKRGLEILGFISPEYKKGSLFCGYKILGDDEIIDSFISSDIGLANGIGFIAKNKKRKIVAKKFRDKGYHFISIIDPSAIISSSVILEQGVQIMAGVIIQHGSSIGQDTIINTGSLIDHDCIINNDCHVAPGVTMSGNVNIGEESFVGVGSSIANNIFVGHNCTIAAGSVVFKDIGNDDTFIQVK